MAKHVATLISDFWVSKFVQYHLQESAPASRSGAYECTGRPSQKADAIINFLCLFMLPTYA